MCLYIGPLQKNLTILPYIDPMVAYSYEPTLPLTLKHKYFVHINSLITLEFITSIWAIHPKNYWKSVRLTFGCKLRFWSGTFHSFSHILASIFFFFISKWFRKEEKPKKAYVNQQKVCQLLFAGRSQNIQHSDTKDSSLVFVMTQGQSDHPLFSFFQF